MKHAAKRFMMICASIVLFSSCVSLTKVNYPAGVLVTQSQWQPKVDSTIDNKPIAQIRYSRWSLFLPLSIDEGLKEAVNKAGGKTLTNVSIAPSSLWILFHALEITGEVSRK
jgi:hypothetical protein